MIYMAKGASYLKRWVFLQLCKTKHKKFIFYSQIAGTNQWGLFLGCPKEPFGPEKPVVKLQSACFEKILEKQAPGHCYLKDPQTHFGLYHRFPWNFACDLHLSRLASKQVSFYLFVHVVYFSRGVPLGHKNANFSFSKSQYFHKVNIFRRASKFNAESFLSIW